MSLPPGVTPPSPKSIEAFVSAAQAAHPGLEVADNWEARWIGFDDETTQQIFGLIRERDKTGTFTLPWIAERTGSKVPCEGLHLILVDMSGRPTLLLKLGEVREALFGNVTAADTAIDGSPVRDPEVWVPLHTQYWNALLEPHGLTVSDDMPFWIEPFDLIFDADAPSE
jgi:uncharacterized protein YhfF